MLSTLATIAVQLILVGAALIIGTATIRDLLQEVRR